MRSELLVRRRRSGTHAKECTLRRAIPESGLLPASETDTRPGFHRPTRGHTGPHRPRRQSRTPTHRPDGCEHDPHASLQPHALSVRDVSPRWATEVESLSMSGLSLRFGGPPTQEIAAAATLPEHPCPGLRRSYRRTTISNVCAKMKRWRSTGNRPLMPARTAMRLGPNLILVGWVPCTCATSTTSAGSHGHRTFQCRRCSATIYRPPHVGPAWQGVQWPRDDDHGQVEA